MVVAAGAPKLNALLLAVVAADAPKLNGAVAAAGAEAAEAEAPKAKAEDDAGPPKEKGGAGLPGGSEAAGLAGPPKENREDVAAAGAGSGAVSSGGSARKLNEGFFGGMPAPARGSSTAAADGAPPPKAEAALVPLVEADPKAKGAGAVAVGSGARGAEGPEGKVKVTVLAAGSAEASRTPEPFGAEKVPKLGEGTPAKKGCVKLNAEAGWSRSTCMDFMCQKLGGGSHAGRDGVHQKSGGRCTWAGGASA